jgi:hypothetical protein
MTAANWVGSIDKRSTAYICIVQTIDLEKLIPKICRPKPRPSPNGSIVSKKKNANHIASEIYFNDRV